LSPARLLRAPGSSAPGRAGPGAVGRSLSDREIEPFTLVARGISNQIVGKDLRTSEQPPGVDRRSAAITAALEPGA